MKKFAFHILIFLIILLPFFIPDRGLDQGEYLSVFDIPEGQFIEVDGYRTYYLDFNPDFENTILFVHGFGGSSTNWLEIISELEEEEFRLISVDLKGFGFAEKRKGDNYSYASQVEFLNSFIEKLDLQNINIAGHSMGGNIATMYYQKHPERIASLLLVSPSILEKQDIDVITVNALKVFNWPIIREYVRTIMKFAMSGGRTFWVFNTAMYEEQEVKPPYFVDPTLFAGWEYVVISMFSSADMNALEKDLSEIKPPTLIVWGKEDTWTSFERGKYLNSRIENSELVLLDGVGHLPLFEDPEGVADAIRNALNNS